MIFSVVTEKIQKTIINKKISFGNDYISCDRLYKKILHIYLTRSRQR